MRSVRSGQVEGPATGAVLVGLAGRVQTLRPGQLTVLAEAFLDHWTLVVPAVLLAATPPVRRDPGGPLRPGPAREALQAARVVVLGHVADHGVQARRGVATHADAHTRVVVVSCTPCSTAYRPSMYLTGRRFRGHVFIHHNTDDRSGKAATDWASS